MTPFTELLSSSLSNPISLIESITHDNDDDEIESDEFSVELSNIILTNIPRTEGVYWLYSAASLHPQDARCA